MARGSEATAFELAAEAGATGGVPSLAVAATAAPPQTTTKLAPHGSPVLGAATGLAPRHATERQACQE